MACETPGGGSCGTCDACKGAVAYDWNRVAGSAGQGALAASGGQAWDLLGLKGWGGQGGSVFCEMLEQIARLLQDGERIQSALGDTSLASEMAAVSDATWKFDPPQSLQTPEQMYRLENVLTTKLLPPLNAMMQKIAATPGEAAGVNGVGESVQSAMALHGKIRANGSTMIGELSRFKSAVTSKRTQTTFDARLSGLRAAAPFKTLPGLRGGPVLRQDAMSRGGAASSAASADGGATRAAATWKASDTRARGDMAFSAAMTNIRQGQQGGSLGLAQWSGAGARAFRQDDAGGAGASALDYAGVHRYVRDAGGLGAAGMGDETRQAARSSGRQMPVGGSPEQRMLTF